MKNIIMKYRFLLSVFLLIVGLAAYAQPETLAQEYFKNGEYEKAAVLYKQLYEQNQYSDFYFTRYLTSLLSLENYKEAEGLIKKQSFGVVTLAIPPNTAFLQSLPHNDHYEHATYGWCEIKSR
ncbi:MAG: hypothetical protein HC803_01860 [Saprospiraceae bacterium]|nr:hypothetical protein [Saprospiraceae bacterium]